MLTTLHIFTTMLQCSGDIRAPSDLAPATITRPSNMNITQINQLATVDNDWQWIYVFTFCPLNVSIYQKEIRK